MDVCFEDKTALQGDGKGSAYGPILPFARRHPFRTAARQTGLSLRPRNLGASELTVSGRRRPLPSRNECPLPTVDPDPLNHANLESKIRAIT